MKNVLISKNLLYLNIFLDTISDGLVIQIQDNQLPVSIAIIYWDENAHSCYIRSVEENLQNYITTFERYKDFIYLVDEAYYLIKREWGVVE